MKQHYKFLIFLGFFFKCFMLEAKQKTIYYYKGEKFYSIVLNNFSPPILFTDFKLFNKPVIIGSEESPLNKQISETTEIILTHKQSNFSISWVVLNYKNPEKVQYAYKMEGYEKDWNYIGPARTATYTNLEPGKYTFRVKASNNDGVWNKGGSSILFIIYPPFWNTFWFRGLFAFFLLAIILVWIRIRTNNLRQLKVKLDTLLKERTFELQLANKILEEQQEEIISQRNYLEIKNIEIENQKEKIELISQQLHESDQKKVRFLDNISHEFRTPLTLNVSPLERILLSVTNANPLFEQLQLININDHRLLWLINQLMDIRKLETQNMKLQVNEGDKVMYLKNLKIDFINEPDKKSVLTADEQFLLRAMVIVEQNILEAKFDVLMFSRCLAMSERQLYRKIKALTDKTVNYFILSVKLNKASELLTQKHMTISEVAYSVGFSSPGYFTKCFKEQYGKTPSEFLEGV